MKPNQILEGDIREIAPTLPAQAANCIVTSPPYWGLRDYGQADQIGQETTLTEYVKTMVGIFRELRRVLREDGTLWLNLGDRYANVGKWGGRTGGKHADGLPGSPGLGRNKQDYGGLKPKNLVGLPWHVALALQADGWYLRSDIIWAKPNPMPESVTDRPTRAHEYIFLLSKSEQYYYDAAAIKEPAVNSGGGPFSAKYAAAQPAHGGKSGYRRKADSFKRNGSKREQPVVPGQGYGTHRPDRKESDWDTATRNRRSVWIIATKPYAGAHFATFPPALIEPCILAGCPPGGVVLDPFFGSGTVGQVAIETGRQWLGVELSPDYIRLAEQRTAAARRL